MKAKRKRYVLGMGYPLPYQTSIELARTKKGWELKDLKNTDDVDQWKKYRLVLEEI